MPEHLPELAPSRLTLMTGADVPPRFYRRDGDRLRCIVCGAADGDHEDACPVLELHARLRVVIRYLGLSVASMRELLELLDPAEADE